jgi:pimeloyl-ACP methyl ester carboxylesterase
MPTTTLESEANTPHALQVHCEGPVNATPPFVMFETEISSSFLDWSWVQRALTAKGVRSCAYSRSGIAYSQQGVNPRTAATMALEFADLMDYLGWDVVKDNVILVGQGYASFIMLLYYSLYGITEHTRNSVKGMIFVDGVHPLDIITPATAPTLCNPNAAPIYDTSLLSYLIACPTGVSRFTTLLNYHPFFFNPYTMYLPTDIQQQLTAILLSCSYFSTVYEEVGYFPVSCGQVYNSSVSKVNGDTFITHIHTHYVGAAFNATAPILRNYTTNLEKMNTINGRGKSVLLGGNASNLNVLMQQDYANSVTKEILTMISANRTTTV